MTTTKALEDLVKFKEKLINFKLFNESKHEIELFLI